MKISWGHKIAFIYCSFAALVIFMVFKSMQYPVDLVTENYYERTVNYEEQISKINNSGLPENKIQFNHKNSSLEILFPVEKKVKGEVKFFKPDNSQLDFAINIDEGKIVYDTSKLAKGKWRVQINWLADNMAVYNEKTLIIN